MITPDPNAKHVTRFCASMSDVRPVLLPITPDSNAEVDNCFFNVRSRVERDGGAIVFGWAIWEWPRVFIEAEHHAVYDAGTGPWLDVTPSSNPADTARLFVADPTATYDFENEGTRVDNRRHALTNEPLIYAYFRKAEQKTVILNQVPGFGEVEVVGALAEELWSIESEMAQLARAIGMKHTRRNDLCFCGSGRKFKKCCKG